MKSQIMAIDHNMGEATTTFVCSCRMIIKKDMGDPAIEGLDLGDKIHDCLGELLSKEREKIWLEAAARCERGPSYYISLAVEFRKNADREGLGR